MNSKTVSIKDLKPISDKVLCIKAQVTSISKKKKYNNKNGAGSYFTVIFNDGTGEIMCVAFNEVCDKFYDELLTDKWYVISYFDIKACDTRYANSNHAYELVLQKYSEVILNEAEAPIDTSNTYTFVHINAVASTVDRTLDVIGVCVDVGIIQNVDKKPFRKLILVDDSCAELESITVTVWESDFAIVENAQNQVVCLKRARVNEYNGAKSLSSSGHITLNPDIPRAHDLRGWYRAKTESWTIIADAIRVRDKKSWCHAVVTQVYGGQCQLYKSCKQCKDKKMTYKNGTFICDNCRSRECAMSILLKAQVSDPSGSLDVAAFTEVAEQMLGTTVQQLNDLLHDDNAIGRVFDALRYKSFMFNFDNYKTDIITRKHPKSQAVVTAVQPVDHKCLNEHILLNIPDIDSLSRPDASRGG